jgi:hypothetical protein
MCTLSVIARTDGYLLAMNRDERIVRGAGELPEIHQLNGTTATYPSDGAGGTWIAGNQHGITLALLNQNSIVQRALDSSKVRSRGAIIPTLASAPSLAGLQAAFCALNLEGIQPFRLVGVFPSERAIVEWGWDSSQIMFKTHGWQPRHWFSSSLSDSQAESLRGAACRAAQHELDAGSAPWLRRLHASHAGGPGPFSLCVHRDDVKTLSYSELVVTPGRIQMEHFRGSPCTMDQIHRVILRDFSPEGSGAQRYDWRAEVHAGYAQDPSRPKCRSG